MLEALSQLAAVYIPYSYIYFKSVMQQSVGKNMKMYIHVD